MNCGYGYTKDSYGYCQAVGWYETTLGCYETTIIQGECGWNMGPWAPSASAKVVGTVYAWYTRKRGARGRGEPRGLDLKAVESRHGEVGETWRDVARRSVA
jgi:hypothetical protein